MLLEILVFTSVAVGVIRNSGSCWHKSLLSILRKAYVCLSSSPGPYGEHGDSHLQHVRPYCVNRRAYIFMVLLSYKSQKSLPYSAAVAVALKKVMFVSHPPVCFSGSRWNYVALTSLMCLTWQESSWGSVVCPVRSTLENCGLSIASVWLCWSWVHPRGPAKRALIQLSVALYLLLAQSGRHKGLLSEKCFGT